jgi:hypothetical protein
LNPYQDLFAYKSFMPAVVAHAVPVKITCRCACEGLSAACSDEAAGLQSATLVSRLGCKSLKGISAGVKFLEQTPNRWGIVLESILMTVDRVVGEWTLRTSVTEPFYGALSRKVQVLLHGVSVVRTKNGEITD